MALSFKGHEGQANASVLLATCGGVLAIAGTFFVFQRFDWDSFAVSYAVGTKRLPMILGLLGLASALSAIGFYLGITSANQPRNKKIGVSWMGFFLNAIIMTLALSVAAFFWATKFPVKG